MISIYRTYIELSRSTHSRAQIKALDKKLTADPTTRKNYTGLNGRRFCFAFESEATLQIFMREAAQMLTKRFNIDA